MDLATSRAVKLLLIALRSISSRYVHEEGKALGKHGTIRKVPPRQSCGLFASRAAHRGASISSGFFRFP
jgi:hypothetical protein